MTIELQASASSWAASIYGLPTSGQHFRFLMPLSPTRLTNSKTQNFLKARHRLNHSTQRRSLARGHNLRQPSQKAFGPHEPNQRRSRSSDQTLKYLLLPREKTQAVAHDARLRCRARKQLRATGSAQAISHAPPAAARATLRMKIDSPAASSHQHD